MIVLWFDFVVIKRKLFCYCMVMIKDNYLSYKCIIWCKIYFFGLL